MKKFLVIALCLMIFLSGCAKKDERINIQFASWGSKTEVEIIKSVISDFEAENPDIKIEFLHIPQNYFQKLHLLFASNTEPDVMFLNNLYLPIYANAGRLEPLSAQKNVYNSKILDALGWHGELYAIPRDISLLVVYYNKDLFKRAGVSVPQTGWTFDDMLEKSRKIQAKTGAFGISFEEEPLFYLPYVMSEGGSFYELESEPTRRALGFYADLRGKHHVAPRREESASATMAQMFLQEKIAMHLSGRWLTPKYMEDANFPWNIVPFPRGAKGSIVPLDASGWAVAKSSNHKPEALRFVEYMASKPVIDKFAVTGLIVPARNDVDFTGKEVYLKTLKTAQPTPVSVDYNKLTDRLKIELENLFN
ncbi:MAG: sugar ABC transporter substrate-binding protein [Fusobacterium sp.]|nr:sugar ABC transporter substrate-binding protein [Fusobacterium sp.]